MIKLRESKITTSFYPLTITYKEVSPGKDDSYEYAEDNDPIWKKASKWVSIEYMKSKDPGKKQGSLAFTKFLETLEKGTGVILNPSPEDEKNTSRLINWYKKFGFEKNTTDQTLFKII